MTELPSWLSSSSHTFPWKQIHWASHCKTEPTKIFTNLFFLKKHMINSGTGVSHLIKLTFSPFCLYKPHGQMLGPDATPFFSCHRFYLPGNIIYIILIFLVFSFVRLPCAVSDGMTLWLYKAWTIGLKKNLISHYLKAFQQYIVCIMINRQLAKQWCRNGISGKNFSDAFLLCPAKMINTENMWK